jgi:hypothetical protein
MEKELHWCTGCERVIHCDRAFRGEAEGCDLYIRSSYHRCYECTRFGGPCKKNGLNKCDFQPRQKSPQKLALLKKLEQSMKLD